MITFRSCTCRDYLIEGIFIMLRLDQVLLREEMEAALKESLRESERAAQRLKRSSTDVEYLKNTVRM